MTYHFDHIQQELRAIKNSALNLRSAPDNIGKATIISDFLLLEAAGLYNLVNDNQRSSDVVRLYEKLESVGCVPKYEGVIRTEEDSKYSDFETRQWLENLAFKYVIYNSNQGTTDFELKSSVIRMGNLLGDIGIIEFIGSRDQTSIQMNGFDQVIQKLNIRMERYWGSEEHLPYQ